LKYDATKKSLKSVYTGTILDWFIYAEVGLYYVNKRMDGEGLNN